VCVCALERYHIYLYRSMYSLFKRDLCGYKLIIIRPQSVIKGSLQRGGLLVKGRMINMGSCVWWLKRPPGDLRKDLTSGQFLSFNFDNSRLIFWRMSTAAPAAASDPFLVFHLCCNFNRFHLPSADSSFL